MRLFLAALLTILSVGALSEQAVVFPEVTPGYEFRFPRDEGSHPAFRLEWWYVTGWLTGKSGKPYGFQITFFRSRQGNVATGNPSKFSPEQILLAHGAISDPAEGKILHDRRLARVAFDLVYAREGSVDVAIRDWSLRQQGNRYRTAVRANDFSYELEFTALAPPMLNGENGFSQKSPNPLLASYYYSIPQLRVTGHINVKGREDTVVGTAWFDHEWSSRDLDPAAVGWDWTGINFDDGGALMVYRMRDKSEGNVWASATYRAPNGETKAFGPQEVSFRSKRRWRSKRSPANYPVEALVRAGSLQVLLQPLMDDQELDSDPASRAIYWEGAVRALQNGKPAGRGYLELTGYAKPLNLE